MHKQEKIAYLQPENALRCMLLCKNHGKGEATLSMLLLLRMKHNTMKKNLLTALFILGPVTTNAQVKQDTFRGKASYYSLRMTGRKTASGERFHNDSLMCAHRTLPFGTLLRVRNLNNNKEVILKVTDRGPYSKKYILDITQRAARELGFLRKGFAPIEAVILPEGVVPFEAETDSCNIMCTIKSEFTPDSVLFEPEWQANDSLPPLVPHKNAGVTHKRSSKKHVHHSHKKHSSHASKKRVHRPAKKSTRPVAKKTTSPAKKATTPVKKTTTPAQKTTAPVKKATTPVKKATTPAQKTTAPVKKTTSPTVRKP